jgi:hypothetical protein
MRNNIGNDALFSLKVCNFSKRYNNSTIYGNNQSSEPRVVTTRYGNSTGMIVTFQNKLLHPIEVFRGFQYASTRRDKMRFIPPVSSLEKWLGIRMFSNRSYRGVCPQPFNIVKNNSVNSSFHFLNRLRRVETYTIYQGE